MPFTNFTFNDLPYIGGTISWLSENNLDFAYIVTGICAFLLYTVWSVSDTLLPSGFSFFFTLAPIWLPLITFSIWHFRHFDGIRKRFYLQQGRIQYRIKLPQEVLKSPEAMEFVLNQLWNQATPDNFYEGWIQGKAPQPASLEMVSIGGDVRFYVNISRKKMKEQFVPSIYSQYPGIELVEEPVDYAGEIKVGDPEWEIWSTHLNKKDKKWGPIKTYVEFGLQDNPKEEEKVDPITILLDRLGEIGPNERLYFQIIIRAANKPSLVRGDLRLFEGPSWNKMAEERVDELLKRDHETKGPLNAGDTDFEGSPRISPGEREDVEAIERNATKHAFRGNIRYLYAARKGHFRSDLLNPLNRTFSIFDSVGRGSIGVRWRTDFNYMWFSDPFGDLLPKYRAIEHKHYKLRKLAPHCQGDEPKIWTVEELATMFHIPGTVALTPTLDRIASNRAEAPSNLPIFEPPTQP